MSELFSHIREKQKINSDTTTSTPVYSYISLRELRTYSVLNKQHHRVCYGQNYLHTNFNKIRSPFGLFLLRLYVLVYVRNYEFVRI